MPKQNWLGCVSPRPYMALTCQQLILQARCYLSCHNSAPANPAPGRTPQVFYNMKLHKDLSQPNLVCVQRQGLGHSPYRVRLLTLYLVHRVQQQQHVLPSEQTLVRFIGRVKLKARSPPVYTMALTVVAGH